MRKLLFILIPALLLAFVVVLTAQIESKNKLVETKGTTIEQTRGGNPNIKEAKPVDDKVVSEKPTPAPRSATDYCKVIIDNWTGYTVDIYVDGYYEGSCAAWSEGYTYAVAGATVKI